ncbi:MAG: Ig-like domain-containing protein [Acidimicrobiales bacterium]
MRLTVRVSVVSILLASLVLMGSGVMASGVASASPLTCYPPGSTSCAGTLTVAPSPVVRGATVTVTGNGFSAGAAVSINVCNIQKITTEAFNVGLLGHIKASFKMPDSAPLGACKFTATGLGTNNQTLTLTTTVIVKSATTTVLKLSPAKVTYGDEQVELMSVKVSPEFAVPTPTGKVTISAGKTSLCVLALLSGKASCGLTNKELKTAGTYHIVATYGGSLEFVGSFATETLTVVTLTVVTGTLTVAPSTIVRGATVTVTGKGFSAGAAVSINVCNIKKVTTAAFNEALLGHINVSFKMPDGTPLGACKFTATGLGTNNQTLTLTTTVIVKSATKTVLKLSAAKVTYGDEQVELMSVKVSPEFTAPAPTGKVTISDGKTTLCVIALLSGKGSCGLTAKELKNAGTYHIVATYGGSLEFVGSFATETLTVVR